MKANETPLRHSRLVVCSFVISVICLLVGGLVVLGWLFDVGYLKSIAPDFVNMKVNTAVCFILAGVALWASHSKAPIPPPRRLGQVCAFLICVIGLLTLLEYLLQRSLGIDELLWPQPTEALISAAPGRMSFVTALTFFLLGSALLLLNLDKARSITGAQIIAVVTSIVPLIGLIGYSYSIEPLYQISAFSSMALHTAITAELLCLGILFARPDQGLMASVTSPNSGGVMARRLLPVAVLLPILIGWLRLMGQRAGYYDTIFGVVLLVISFIISFVIILWFNARALNRIDDAQEQSKQETRETEERFRIMADTAPVMVWMSGLDKLYYWFNKSWLEFTGRTMEQEMGKGWVEGVHPDDFDRCLRIYRNAFDARLAFSMEYRLRRHDGKYRWVMNSGIPRNLPDGSFAGYIGSCIDITERKQAEQKLNETNQTLQTFIQASPLAIVALDMERKVTLWNPAAEQMFGWTEAEVLGQPLPTIPPEDISNQLALREQFLRTGGGSSFSNLETRRLRKDGSLIEVSSSFAPLRDTQGNIIGTMGILTDITERKRAEERFRLAVESAPNAMVMVNQEGKIVLVNSQTERLFGYTRAELIGQSVELLVPERFRQQHSTYRINFAAAPQTRAMGAGRDLFGLHKDGSEMPIEIGLTPIEMKDEILVLSSIVDITERKRYEAELSESRARFAGIISSAMDAIITIDTDQRITLFNAAAEKMFGCSAAEALGHSIEQFIPPRFRQAHREHVKDFSQTNVSKRAMGSLGAIYGLRANGEEFPIEASISQIEINGQKTLTIILRDITERQRVGAALRQSEEHFRAIFEGAGVGNVECDAVTGRFLFVNRKLCEITGYSSEELLGKSFPEITHPADRELNFDHYRRFVEGEAPDYAVEKRYIRKDGSIVWVHVTSTLLHDANGRPWRTIAVVQDITERKRAEEEVQKLNADLEKRVIARTEELAAANREMEAFSYSVSHDLRAPLRAIDGFSRILVEEYTPQLPAEAFDYLQLVRDNTQQMGKLIDDLLGFSRLNRHDLRKQLISPTIIVHQALSQLQHEQAGRRVEITIGDMPDCLADPALLKQVFINLLSNALKFTSRCGEAVINVGCLPQANSGSPPIYFVKDNGVGFDMKYSHKLFNVFQRLHRAEDYEGTGVGLATVQRIIQRHGGRIWAEAVLHQGATFFFTLEGEVSA